MPVCDLTNRKIKRILITCSDTDRLRFNVDADRYFEDGYLRINAPPDRITFENAYLSDGGYKPTFQGLRYFRSSVMRGFSIKPIETDYKLFSLVNYLARTKGATGTLITILDFSAPETADIEAAISGNTEPYTARSGRIYNVQLEEGSVGKKTDTLACQWSFKFQEALVRAGD